MTNEDHEKVLEELAEDGSGAGIELEDEASEITHPFDPKEIDIKTKAITIDLLLSRIEHNEILLTPDFQRQASIWKSKSKSRLIESILLRIPLPVFYIHTDEDDHWLVVDGLQRLSAIDEFVRQKSWALDELEFLKQFEGFKFDKLPRPMQRRINESELVIHLIQPGTPKYVTRTIFRRINTGGLPLSSQEIRHALYQGHSTELLKKLVQEEAFLDATTLSLRDSRMGGREAILRYLSFRLTPPTDYKRKDLDGFLCRSMEAINAMKKKEIFILHKNFLKSMNRNREVFGGYAFRKQYHRNGYRYPINKALFETWSLEMSRITSNEFSKINEQADEVQKKFIELMKGIYLPSNTEKSSSRLMNFEMAISQDTSDPVKVQYRFKAIKGLIQDLL